MESNENKILVLGVGNILYTDEGVGVRVVERLMQQYSFSENVTLMDGGTLGSRLMDPLLNCTHVIVVDAVLGGDEPGSIYRLTGEDLRKSLAFKNSMHQTDLVDTLIMCDLVGNRPEAVVIGIEPEDYSSLCPELSATTLARMDQAMEIVLSEIEALGGTHKPASKDATVKE